MATGTPQGALIGAGVGGAAGLYGTHQSLAAQRKAKLMANRRARLAGGLAQQQAQSQGLSGGAATGAAIQGAAGEVAASERAQSEQAGIEQQQNLQNLQLLLMALGYARGRGGEGAGPSGGRDPAF
jgi:hypothetical protein